MTKITITEDQLFEFEKITNEYSDKLEAWLCKIDENDEMFAKSFFLLKTLGKYLKYTDYRLCRTPNDFQNYINFWGGL